MPLKANVGIARTNMSQVNEESPFQLPAALNESASMIMAGMSISPSDMKARSCSQPCQEIGIREIARSVENARHVSATPDHVSRIVPI